MEQSNTQDEDGSEEQTQPPRMWSQTAIRGAQALRKHLRPLMDEEIYLNAPGALQMDARGYVIYGALDEIEKAASFLDLTEELLSGDAVSPSGDRVARNILTWILEDVFARGRRLIELLVDLVLFTQTNDQQHFRHLLLLHDLAAHIRKSNDLKDFEDISALSFDKAIDKTIAEIVSMRLATPSLASPWFVGCAIQIGRRPSPNNIVTSARMRIKLALPHMTPEEKISFGFTYGGGFGDASEMIHYSARREGRTIEQVSNRHELARVGMLSWEVLLRCHELLGKPVVPVVTDLAQLYTKNLVPDDLLHQRMVSNLACGDFVLVDKAFLADILEVKDSIYGYRSFRVRFLDERPYPDIAEDWVPARNIEKQFTPDELIQAFPNTSGLLSEEDRLLLAQSFAACSPEERQEAFRQSAKEIWRAWKMHRANINSQPNGTTP